MEVRRAAKKDIPEILDLLVQVNMVHHNGRPDLFKGPATKYDAYELGRLVENDRTPVFVCTDDDGRILGHMFCISRQFENDSVMTDVKTLYIDDICVDENARGRGVGRMLYGFIRDFAGREGFYNITLNVWSCNPGALEFYRAMGLKPYKIGMEEIVGEP